MTLDKLLALVSAHLVRWRATLGLEDWRITLERDDSAPLMAGCEADPSYKTATVTVNTRRMLSEDLDALEVEAVMVHELVHAKEWFVFNVLADPRTPPKVLEHLEETHVEDVTRCLLKAKYPRRAQHIDRMWAELVFVLKSTGEKPEMNQ